MHCHEFYAFTEPSEHFSTCTVSGKADATSCSTLSVDDAGVSVTQ